ncbi:YiiX/YebB-like N1pC/P60 family cysteine hydrolase [Citrobacter freundii]|uniref:YiiX/YebB-like N1pC/P60 family cysteine hydrolase n=2 Tax=Citrobacter freundii TaxID=546 RepID=UPI0024B22B79|nr:YiiX/YebB-like N1pC/P60 family cysteine hydrolase [Citrobacter freundii]WHM96224.1 YiiX/YebB-like N1pC/P60 family cysteine hydrolase [Citrobacter freundii]
MFLEGDNLKPGDVLLVKGIGKKSDAILYAQKAFYLKAKSSHVALSLGGGLFIHATSDGGVHLTSIDKELETCEGNWRVIRKKGLEEVQVEALNTSGLYFARQKYNMFVFFEGNEYSSFCSELVAKAYKKAGVKIMSGKPSSKVLPCHFDKEADVLVDWEDVSHEYEHGLADIAENNLAFKYLFELLKQCIERRTIVSKFRKQLFDFSIMDAKARGDYETINRVESLKKELDEKRSLKFWDEKDTLPFLFKRK